ncbi:MAG: hypothetical protein AAGA65_30710 [Actinomycetota bacterium]
MANYGSISSRPTPSTPTRVLGPVGRSLRLGWWYSLWRLRPVGRVFLARTGLATAAVTTRNVWHWVIANAFTLTVKALLWVVLSWCPLPWCLSFDLTLWITLAWAAVMQIGFILATNGGAPARLLMRWRAARVVFGWKLAWRFRSRWPMEWAIPANKTRAVQAEVGNTSEATVTIRPVFDAPKMSWWPQIEWPTISWMVSPPPGRTFAQFEQVLDVLASNIANVVEMTVDYERSSSSIGRLSVLFDDPLAEPILPADHTNPSSPRHDGERLAEVIDLRPQPVGPFDVEVEY